VDELEDSGDLRLLVKTYLQSLSGVPINGIVDFYQNVRQRAARSLADGTGRRPHFRLFCSRCRLFLMSSFYTDEDRSLRVTESRLELLFGTCDLRQP